MQHGISQQKNLTRHLKIHEKTKVKCEDCNDYLSKRSLKNHKKVMHETIREKKKRGPYKQNTEFSKSHIRKIAKSYVDDIKNNMFSDGLQDQVVKNIVHEFKGTFEKLMRQEALNEKDVIQMITNAHLTDRQALTILSCLRKKWGNNIITKGIKEALVTRKKVFHEFFERKIV